jgi:hypothetical protein
MADVPTDTSGTAETFITPLLMMKKKPYAEQSQDREVPYGEHGTVKISPAKSA